MQNTNNLNLGLAFTTIENDMTVNGKFSISLLYEVALVSRRRRLRKHVEGFIKLSQIDFTLHFAPLSLCVDCDRFQISPGFFGQGK